MAVVSWDRERCHFPYRKIESSLLVVIVVSHGGIVTSLSSIAALVLDLFSLLWGYDNTLTRCQPDGIFLSTPLISLYTHS